MNEHKEQHRYVYDYKPFTTLQRIKMWASGVATAIVTTPPKDRVVQREVFVEDPEYEEAFRTAVTYHETEYFFLK